MTLRVRAAAGGVGGRLPHTRRLRRTRRPVLGAWFALLLLAGNLLAAPGLRLPDATAADPLGGALVICTPGGLVAVDQGGTPAGHDERRSPSDLCAFCLPLAHGGIDRPPAAPAPMAPAPVRGERPAPCFQSAASPARPPGGLSARGPPAPA